MTALVRVGRRDRRGDRGPAAVEGYEVEVLDLVDGFDVGDPTAWERVGPVDLACLNAGVLTGERDVTAWGSTSTAARSR